MEGGATALVQCKRDRFTVIRVVLVEGVGGHRFRNKNRNMVVVG